MPSHGPTSPPHPSTRQDAEVTDVDESLPTGAVTFLLTDIEGSTRAWQSAPDRMAELVSAHYELLDAGIAAHGGRRPEEQGEGDSVVAVFVDPAAAVAAALETQLSLLEHLPALSVRMGLHTGDATLRNQDNYVGLTIIRAARIRACAHGGQIVLSDDTIRRIDASGASLPAGASLADLGVYGLRGLDGRERLWQLEHPDLPQAFPPLQAGTSAAGNLPMPLGALVGRRDQLAVVSRSLADSRVVSLVGSPGIGKSRLAHAVADAVANSMPGGIWWVPLADLADDDLTLVTTAVARSCSLPLDELDAIVDHFASIAGSLVIVDGTDRAPGAAAELVERLLVGSPETQVLHTGHDAFGLPGEVVHEVPPLAVPADGIVAQPADLDRFDGTRLFVERFTGADEALTDDDVDHVVQLCRGLGGVPLAIELAAARARTMPLAELAASLDDLGREGRGVADALASSIAWSYEFLGPDEQVTLRRLGIFRGDVEVDAASGVVPGAQLSEPAAVEAIRHLVEQNLVSFDSTAERLRLSPSVRAFAHDALVRSGELPAVVQRHGVWFAAVAERFDGDAGLPVSLLAPDEADVIAALETSMDSYDGNVAYRIMVALGGQLRNIGYGELVDRVATWIQGRSPSDGEELWAATVARLCLDQAGRGSEAVFAFADEARAIAELVGDEVAVERLVDADRHRGSDADDTVTPV